MNSSTPASVVELFGWSAATKRTRTVELSVTKSLSRYVRAFHAVLMLVLICSISTHGPPFDTSTRNVSISAVVLLAMSSQKYQSDTVSEAALAADRSIAGEVSVVGPPSRSCDEAVPPAAPSPVTKHLVPEPGVASAVGDAMLVPLAVPIGTPAAHAPEVTVASLVTVHAETSPSKLCAIVTDELVRATAV